MCGLHKCGGDPTLDIYTYPEVGLLPLGREVSSQAFYHGLRLCYQKAVYLDYEGVKVMAFLDTGIQIIVCFNLHQGGFSPASFGHGMQHPYS